MCNQAGCGACVVTAEMKDPNGVDRWKTKSVNTVSKFGLGIERIIAHMLCFKISFIIEVLNNYCSV